MEEKETTITLIGTKLAKIGNEFIFKGGAKDCETCKLNRTCLSLNIGSKYRIVNIRTGGKHDCLIHESGVSAVEVIEAPFLVAVESRKAIKGSKIVNDSSCSFSDCENYYLCMPDGIRKGEKFTIIDIKEDISDSCRKGYSLKVVEVKR